MNSPVNLHVNSQWLYLHACSLHMTKQAKNLSIDQRRAREVLSLAEELLAVGGFLGRVSHFPARMRPVREHVCSNRWSHTHPHTGGAKWTQWALKKQEYMKLGGKVVGRMWKNLKAGECGRV